MASEILRKFGEWLASVSDEELLASLQEVDIELSMAQQAVDMELYSEGCEFTTPKFTTPKTLEVFPSLEYSVNFSDVQIEAA